ncbi:Rieske (2Fe-2S) protein [Nocardioides jishulii]|uniref:Cytochrome bc1 complex Rieske iron-sulfur subunit n=1 Tax=Nocardioides jishulii TaxID=2575440 RepID=A0A4U2YM23_9ACTN|nr:Rieske (2Fe-2S) protein [Nocardioides jishulii]QCX27472.1 Rieske (2Fe-2S) protein [Nocardioides jishulii]TKI62279.1 Rieske (2Fe-2S) protein [Nocardioides jishulii]
MSERSPLSHPLTRRRVLATGSAAVAAPLVAACGEDEPTPQVEPPASGTELLKVEDVPVGGCAVTGDQAVVVTQPTEGEFKAFSALCTHKACPVSPSRDGDIPCNCHGSRFSLTDGSVIKGPAQEPLAEVAVEVRDGVVVATEG